MRTRQSMNVSITPELAAFVATQLASGRYKNASEVVRAALRLLEEAKIRRREALRSDSNGAASHER